MHEKSPTQFLLASIRIRIEEHQPVSRIAAVHAIESLVTRKLPHLSFLWGARSRASRTKIQMPEFLIDICQKDFIILNNERWNPQSETGCGWQPCWLRVCARSLAIKATVFQRALTSLSFQ